MSHPVFKLREELHSLRRHRNALQARLDRLAAEHRETETLLWAVDLDIAETVAALQAAEGVVAVKLPRPPE